MSFPAYPTYKDSGSEWIGAIPDHWVASPLKRAFEIEGGSTPKPDEVNWDGDIAWVTPADLSGLSSLFLDSSKRTITATGLASCGSTLLPAGSLILSTRAPIGSLAIALTSMCTNQGCKGLVPNANASAVYFAFVLLTAKDELKSRGRGSTFLEISGDELSRFSVPTPPLAEQIKIARFLDHETARIDALIEEQQRLIELLKEKRQAVISHAVTKGLDPTVPMKDSGVEWLGEVPAHWVVSKFGYISSVVRGGSPRPAGDPELFNGDYSPWVTVAEITKDDEIYLDETETFLTKKGSDQCRVFSKGTLLLSNSGATLGVPKILMIDANANDGVVGFENISLDKEYSYLYLATLTAGLRDRAAGSGQPNLNTDIVKSIDVPIPPSNEVAEIVAAVKKLRAQFNFLSKEAVEGIRLLQERRSALISAAVTGKIDVRGWQPATRAQPPELELEAV
ncbi:restriction endonuclease subunit S [Stenotrophomonas hibiscicola]|uniref:restriction endonuclease subunit S n=1 Tax=Stenotrophomonas hibiscicola TaxID=86189 RepID=UPI002E79ECAE|nr:restriction endonuclease subunit S [[Pseudomonas] hibiscicola]